MPTFLVGWYGGAFLGSFLVVWLMGAKEAGPPLTKKGLGGVAVLALSAELSLALAYWANQLAPLVVTQPIFQVSEMVLPTIIGLWYFKEVLELGKRKRLFFAIALVGSLIIALSY